MRYKEMQADLLAGHCVEWRDITDVTLTLSVIHGDHVIRSVQARTLHHHHHATQHPRQLELQLFSLEMKDILFSAVSGYHESCQ